MKETVFLVSNKNICLWASFVCFFLNPNWKEYNVETYAVFTRGIDKRLWPVPPQATVTHGGENYSQ